jgi:hypothetical protein
VPAGECGRSVGEEGSGPGALVEGVHNGGGGMEGTLIMAGAGLGTMVPGIAWLRETTASVWWARQARRS